MSLLARTPTPSDLARLYHELAQQGAPAVGRADEWSYDPQTHEELLALASEMLRYDPRLLSILVEHFLTSWERIDPRALRSALKATRLPQAFLVVGEFAREAAETAELRFMIDYLGAGYRPVSPAERFFYGVEHPGSRTAIRREGRNLVAYARWGFIGGERPTIDHATKQAVGRYDAATRGRIRRTLAERRGPFQLAEYMDALGHSISRQQAYADLAGDEGFAVEGRGRGARWALSD